MTLVDLIRKRVSANKGVATATPATVATDRPETQPSVAEVAEVAGGPPHSAKREGLPTEHAVGADSAPIIPSQPTEEPTPPLQAGWRIVYLDSLWKLAGGADDPEHGTVEACRWEGGAWSVHLTDGQEIPLSRIRSVAAMDYKGRLMGAWTVREHGYDGQGSP